MSETFVRKTTLSLGFVNAGKLKVLDFILDEYRKAVNQAIDKLWNPENLTKLPKFANLKLDTWLSARMQQAVGKIAIQNCKSQHKKKKKTKPNYQAETIDLDERFWSFEPVEGSSFDLWIKIGSIGNKIKLLLPTKKHKHFNKLAETGKLLKSCRLRKQNGKWFLDVFFEFQKQEPKPGAVLGLDVGLKKLLATSDGKTYGQEIEIVLERIQRKKKNSKSYKRLLHFKRTEINRICNEFANQPIEHLTVEDLKNVKKNTAKEHRLRKQFRSKIQYWNYAQVLRKLEMLSESKGFGFTKVNPAYTSQTCSECGHREKASRKGEHFHCVSCGMEMDADINASKNIRGKGVYSPLVTQNKLP